MPILELFPKPSRSSDSTNASTNATNDDAATAPKGNPAAQPVKLRAGRYGVLEEHEIIHLLDTLGDERSRARFRESIYISLIIYMALAWFVFYGPRVLFHQPQYVDPIALMKQHDKELTFLAQRSAPALKPPPRPVIDRKTIQALQQQARLAAPTPQPPAAPPPAEQAHVTAPPVPQPQLPLPSTPKPAQPQVESPLPAAPRPNFADNTPSAHDSMQDAMRGALGTRDRTDYGSLPDRDAPLQAGATILSDTMGLNLSSYMRRLHDDIQRNWDPLIPEEVEPPLLKKGIVGIRFTILPNGNIGSMTLETRSGDVALDHAAWNAITSENQFPPLPKPLPLLDLRIGFFYNIPLPQ